MSVRGAGVLAGAVLLAACGGAQEEQAADGAGEQVATQGGEDESDGLSAAAVASQAERLVQPRPGEYRTTVELIDFDMPGMPDAVRQQMRATVGASLTQSRDFCLTPEEAASNGPRQMAEKLAQSNCTMERFDVSGNTIVADLSCEGAGGAGAGRMRMEGQMTAEGSVMTMTMDQDLAEGEPMRMKMKVTSERTGECA